MTSKAQLLFQSSKTDKTWHSTEEPRFQSRRNNFIMTK